ncbi:hypothetical protein BC938DRAFT_480795 [Jimgerdemannia flammicorona]|uniref:Uncharacterized protein n=1 Tax=Jimgerdemannia flammicorona TaxID=994334 RepID=A0A433QHP6_9FUNG|nr:hypothetical protein BC938DRAFT_480795 [Jimgerdemannia flammicorona]
MACTLRTRCGRADQIFEYEVSQRAILRFLALNKDIIIAGELEQIVKFTDLRRNDHKRPDEEIPSHDSPSHR